MNYILLVFFSIDPKDLEIMYFPICNFLCPTKLETCMRGKNKISAAFVVTYIDINPKFQYFSGFVSLIIQILRLLLKNYTINLCKSDMCILLTIALCIFFFLFTICRIKYMYINFFAIQLHVCFQYSENISYYIQMI